jgi:ATP-dependent Clp protease ATP-binding subunit ClpC
VFQRFTDQARQVVVLAQEDARELGHAYIGTEHILLGLLRVEDGLAAQALASLALTHDGVRARVEQVVGRGETRKGAGQIPFTPRAKKVLELALREALSLDHDYIGTEHILLGLARENGGVATRILLDAGVDAEGVRSRVHDLLGPERARRRPGRLSFGRRATFFETRPATQWEYLVERRDTLERASLNELGDQGWELVGVVPQDEGFDLVFKRPQRRVAQTRVAGA